MASHRIEKVNEHIRNEVSNILLRELDIKDAFVTITHVETSKDLLHSKVYLTIYPEDREKETLETMGKQIYALQQLLNKRLRMRPVPKLIFMIDKETKIEAKIFEVLK